MEERGLRVEVELAEEPHDDSVGLKKSGCHGFCEMGPLVRIEPQGWLYVKVKPADCEEIVEKTIIGGEHIERLAYTKHGEVFKKQKKSRSTRSRRATCSNTAGTSTQPQLRISRHRRLPRLRDGALRHGRRRDCADDFGLEPARARRRRLPDRTQVEPGAPPEGR